MFDLFVVFKDTLDFIDNLFEGPVGKLAGNFKIGKLTACLGGVYCLNEVFHFDKRCAILL